MKSGAVILIGALLTFGGPMPSEICKLYIDDQVATLDMPSKDCFNLLKSLVPMMKEDKAGTPIYCQCIEGSAQS